MSNYCAADAIHDCKLLADCPTCLCCWAHCWCREHYDPYECRHGVLRGKFCEDCTPESRR